MRIRFATSILAVAIIVPIAALGAPMQPAGAGEPAARTIVVSGSGQASAAPDDAIADFAIETHARTAAAAASANAALATKVVAALKSKLAGKGEISTGGYSLNPEYRQHPGDDNATIVGYTAQNSIRVETGALEIVGPLIDAAIAAGANRVNYLSFTLKDNTNARAKAIAAAAHDAQAQAQALAAALGVKLGRVLKASTEAEVRPMPMMRAMAAGMGASVSTPIESGQVTMPANVTLTYGIE
ncbi:MAG TPA: SIMPL domain-containing protein [Candidatus Binataceae bacterium]|nr:SIMPL domain-containing protein [Candidatus Binataceae bacterium]